ncbi:MAG: helix-turn-helix domain-containing protein [Lachnospiraceae bacterium]|jgi:AraC-like DNA-binding protein
MRNDLELALRFIRNDLGLTAFAFGGSSEVLEAYSREYCFSEKIQPRLTPEGLADALSSLRENTFAEFRDELGISIIVFSYDDLPVIIGPYTEESWHDRKRHEVLAAAGLPGSLFTPYKNYFCRFLQISTQEVKNTSFAALRAVNPKCPEYGFLQITDSPGARGRQKVSEEPQENEAYQKTYMEEDAFVRAVSEGKTDDALRAYARMSALPHSSVFASRSLASDISSAAIIRTLLRRAAYEGGAAPVTVDAVSLSYAQKSMAASSSETLHRMIPEMIREFSEMAAHARSLSCSRPIKKVISYMELHPSAPLDREKLAAESGLGVSRLSHRFKEETGKTMTEYLTSIRCRIAMDLLTGTDLSIQEISAHVGYDDANYFSRIFRKETGSSPKEARSRQDK